jgi:hypothetical protein
MSPPCSVLEEEKTQASLYRQDIYEQTTAAQRGQGDISVLFSDLLTYFLVGGSPVMAMGPIPRASGSQVLPVPLHLAKPVINRGPYGMGGVALVPCAKPTPTPGYSNTHSQFDMQFNLWSQRAHSNGHGSSETFSARIYMAYIEWNKRLGMSLGLIQVSSVLSVHQANLLLIVKGCRYRCDRHLCPYWCRFPTC